MDRSSACPGEVEAGSPARTCATQMFARITFLLMVCISMLLPGGSGSAQTYPDGKPIRLVSGAAPGSATDIVGRAVGVTFRSELGVPVMYHTTVADSLEANVEVFRHAACKREDTAEEGNTGKFVG